MSPSIVLLGVTLVTGQVAPANTFNPAMSVNGLFVGRVTSDRSPPDDAVRTGLGIQEVELQVTANVDPYFGANIIFALPEGEGIEVEEGYVTPSEPVLGLAMRVGKLKLPFGRENLLHTHALPFVTRSLANEAVFGDEGLNEASVEASYLAPLPWYALLTTAVMNGDNEVLFASPHQYAMAGFAGLKNVFDLDDDTTFEVGGSYAGGKSADDEPSHVAGAHLVLRWRPARQARDRELVMTVEALHATRPNDAATLGLTGADAARSGGYAAVQWRLSQRWVIAGRWDELGGLNDARPVTRRGTLLLAFAPTEFSALRLQGSTTPATAGNTAVHEGFLQLNVTVGAHPAHAY